MRHLRPFAALLAIAAMTVGCSAAPGSDSGGAASQGGEASQGGGASQPAASTGGGGGGGGGGANGSMTYEITGDYEASGELPFLAGGVSLWIEESEGWVAYFSTGEANAAVIQINTQSAEGTPGQIWNFGDGTAIVIATSDAGSGNGCTFNLTKNDSSGTEGSIECSSALFSKVDGTGNGTVRVSAEWTGHN